MKTYKIFIASSSELEDDRKDFVNFIYKENFRLNKEEIRLEPIHWEDFLDAMSETSLQNEYNLAIADCDIVVCLFFTKVGKYTNQEFEAAYKAFKEKGRPRIWTYFKRASIDIGKVTPEIQGIFDFQGKLKELGHFYSSYTSSENLQTKFRDQLAKIPLGPPGIDPPGPKDDTVQPDGEPKRDPEICSLNEFLAKKLIVSVAPYHEKVRSFMVNIEDWETNPEVIDIIKNLVFPCYIGVVGQQLRTLLSIETDTRPNDRLKRYFDNVVFTARRAIQLVCFALISSIWEELNSGKIQNIQTKRNRVVRFFNNVTEENVKGYAELLKELIEIYLQNPIEIPFPKLIELHTKLNSERSFLDSCIELHELHVQARGSSYEVAHCRKAVGCLVNILEQLSFLAAYKISSMRAIGYNRLRNEKQGIYLHNYFSLECDTSTATSYEEKVRQDLSPLTSYAVLMYTKDLNQSINLVPFVIDFNALSFEGGSRICFYSFCNTFSDQNLNYRFIGDDTKLLLARPQNQRPENEAAFNKWMAVAANRRDLNFEIVFRLFEESKKALTGIKEEANEAGL